MALPGRERSSAISSAVWIQYTNVTDRRTDTGRQQRPRLYAQRRAVKTITSVDNIKNPSNSVHEIQQLNKVKTSKVRIHLSSKFHLKDVSTSTFQDTVLENIIVKYIGPTTPHKRGLSTAQHNVTFFTLGVHCAHLGDALIPEQ